MKIKLLKPYGFCYGVKRALKIIDDLVLSDTPKPIYVYGHLIHNKEVVSNLEKKGVITLKREIESLENITGTIVFTAHGTSKNIINLAKNKGLVVVDAVCPDVLKNIDIIEQNSDKTILYIGIENHPESEVALEYKNVHLISNSKNLENYKSDGILISQTTMSTIDNKEILDYAKTLKNITIVNEVCKATLNRQNAVINDSECDLIIVIGDKMSHNTKSLSKLKNNTILIETYKDLFEYNLLDKKVIGITAGASTPDYTINKVIDYINEISK